MLKSLSQRLLSIDGLRALTMLAMIFVNDVSGVKNIPSWIEHVDARADGLGFADTVFPAFLFIVGLSIPLAIGRRISRGATFISTEKHIVVRSIALIVMGFFHVNLESYSSEAVLPRALWLLLITIAFFLIWLDYPDVVSSRNKYLLMGTGIVILLVMAALYKGGEPGKTHWMEPSWWGILGIIGWAYLISATLYLLVKGKLSALVIILAVFLGINIATHAGWMRFSIPVLGEASSAALIMGGAVLTTFYSWLQERGKQPGIFIAIGVLAIAVGLLIRPYTDGISKIRATPSWVLICAGITTLLFILLIWLVDVKGKMNWFNVIRPAGTSTLTCYLIPYLVVAVFGLVHFQYPSALSEGWLGLLRSIAFAFLVIAIVDWMEKKKIRLKI